jgi:hypothetical protein
MVIGAIFCLASGVTPLAIGIAAVLTMAIGAACIAICDICSRERNRSMPTPQEDQELKDALAKAKESTDKPRHIVVAYRQLNGMVRTAHGVEHRTGKVHIEDGHGMAISGAEPSLQTLRDTLKRYDIPTLVEYAEEPTEDQELKDAAEAATSLPKKWKPFVVAYRNPGSKDVKVAQGVERPGGSIVVEDGHGMVSGFEPSLDDLRSTMKHAHVTYHITFMDED